MDEPDLPRYRLWSARRCAIVLAVSLVVFVGGVAWLGSLIELHPVGPATRVSAAPELITIDSRRDWRGIAGAPRELQWDADGDGRPEARHRLVAAGDERWRLADDVAIPAGIELRVRYPAVSLWTLLLREFLR